MMELESFRVDRQVIAVARIPHLQWVCLLRPFVLLDALQLLARRASLLSRGRGGGRTRSERCGARSGRAQPRPARLLRNRHLLLPLEAHVALRGNARGVSFTCVGVC